MKSIGITFIALLSFYPGLVAQEKAKNMIGFGCYFQGAETETVIRTRQMIAENKVEEVSALLKKGKNGEKFLAAIILERMAATGKHNLSENEKALIAKIKTSNGLVSVCSGCTYFDKVSLKTMFERENYLGSQFWLDKIFKSENKSQPSK